MTLIEKLKDAISAHKQDAENNRSEDSNVDAVLCSRSFGKIAGLEDALFIVKQHSDWISVDERMPVHDESKDDGFKKYIVYEVLNNKVGTDYYNVITKEWNHFPNFVTHWMPFPEPPKNFDEVKYEC